MINCEPNPDFRNLKVDKGSVEQTTVAISPENSRLPCHHKLAEQINKESCSFTR